MLNQCHYIVLDEADRMIDLGFEPQVRLREGGGGRTGEEGRGEYVLSTRHVHTLTPRPSYRTLHCSHLAPPQVIGVMEAMPSSNLKPEGEDEALDATRLYRTTYMFRCV